MEDLLDSIRAGVAASASDEVRAAGAQACRTILLALEATPGEPLGTAVNASAADVQVPPVAALVGALRGMPPEQLMDLAIARLRAALPAEAAPAPVAPVKFHIVPVGGRR